LHLTKIAFGDDIRLVVVVDYAAEFDIWKMKHRIKFDEKSLKSEKMLNLNLRI